MEGLRLYPGSWLYNALVYGFLKVLAENDFDVEKFLQSDGSVWLDSKCAEILYKDGKIYNLWKKSADDIGGISIVGKNKTFPNLINPSDPPEKREKLIRYLFSYPDIQPGNEVCTLCGESFKPPKEVDERVSTFSFELFGGLSSAIKGFPNRFWNLNRENLPICRKCAHLAMFRPFVFKNHTYFINAPSFKVIWHLNELLRVIEKNRKPENILAISLLESSLKLFEILGGWARQNVEIVNLKTLETRTLPAEVIDALMDFEVQSAYRMASVALKRDQKVLAAQREKFKGRKGKEIYERIANSISTDAVLVSNILSLNTPALIHEAYVRLLKTRRLGAAELPPNHEAAFHISRLVIPLKRLSKGVETLRVDIHRLKELGEEMSENFKRSKYRLLELVRLGRRSDIYHLLLRTYMVAGKEFPTELNRIFTLEDDELFKAHMFTYMSGFKEEEEVDKE